MSEHSLQVEAEEKLKEAMAAGLLKDIQVIADFIPSPACWMQQGFPHVASKGTPAMLWRCCRFSIRHMHHREQPQKGTHCTQGSQLVGVHFSANAASSVLRSIRVYQNVVSLLEA